METYNLLVLCSEDYIVEPASLQFLVQHGFDFSAQYSLGIGYNRGNDPEESDLKKPQPLREIFSELVKAKKPLVLHNGLIDLIFLYHNLWTALPPKLDTFISDVGEMFPLGIYDTKYIADYVARTQASYLEFVFRKELRTNMEKSSKDRPHVRMIFGEYDENDENIDIRHVGSDSIDHDEDDPSSVCSSYANHGHCPEGNKCDDSHDIDLIVSHKAAEQDKKWRKRKVENVSNRSSIMKKPKSNLDNSFNIIIPVDNKSEEVKTKTVVKAGGHRAGYDAFMTGFSFTTFLVHHVQIPSSPQDWSPSSIKTEKIVNRIYLVCKDFPLLMQKSSFAKCSVQHDLKMRKLGLYQD